MEYSNFPQTGTTQVMIYFPFPPLPAIVADWAALLPLVVHLASGQNQHDMIGELCLRGHLPSTIFPPLGLLHGISKLFSVGSGIFEESSNNAFTVWDVSWGTKFRCSNGAARTMLTDLALSKSKNRVCDMDRISSNPTNPNTIFRRPQFLHVINLSFDSDSHAHGARSRFHKRLGSKSTTSLQIVIFLALEALLCLFSAFGTASILMITCLTKVVALSAGVSRPRGYLRSNESYDKACYLAAGHENATSWFLYTGDRAIVDWLLNKTMIDVEPSRACALFFSCAHYFQLLAMTYVAAQKGWDGVCLLTLLALAIGTRTLFGLNAPAREWLHREGICVNTETLRMTGRIPMLGAVQVLSDRNLISAKKEGGSVPERGTTWMDSVVSPSVKREAWTRLLLAEAERLVAEEKEKGDVVVRDREEGLEDAIKGLSQSDRSWVANNLKWTLDAVLAMRAAETVRRQCA